MYPRYGDAKLHPSCGDGIGLHPCSVTCLTHLAWATCMEIKKEKQRWKQKQMASSGLCSPFSPSAMISSTVTWCRPTVKALPMKFPPAWLDPELPPPPPEPGPELTNSRRESKNFLMLSRRQEEGYYFMSACVFSHRRAACLPCRLKLLHK